jgi:hypothetical protein
MIRTALIGLLTITLTSSACSQTKPAKQESQMIIENPFPFQVTETDGNYAINASIESHELISKYHNFFQQHGYSGNGYCWEGHIIQILEKEDKELLEHIDFDPEAGGFYAYADSKEAQIRFINILSPIFSDLKRLEVYVKAADKDRVDD